MNDPTPSNSTANAPADNHLAYCRDRCVPEGSSLYYATLFVPPGRRPAWLGINTLIKDVQAVPLKVQDPGLAAIKLAWWKTEMERAAEGTAGHPATLCMGRETAVEVGIDPVARLVQAVSISQQWPRHFTQAEWDACCRDWGGEAFVMAARALGVGGADKDRSAQDSGSAGSGTATMNASDEAIRTFGAASMRLTQLLMLAPAISQGWHPFPVERLQQAGVSAEALRRRDPSDALHALVGQIADEALRSGEAAWKSLPRSVRLQLRPLRALWRMRVAEYRLALQAGLPLVTQRIRITPLKKFWLAWSSHALRA